MFLKLVTKYAYILFYAKNSVDYFSRQTLCEPDLWPYIRKIEENNKNSQSPIILKSLRNEITIKKLSLKENEKCFPSKIYRSLDNLENLKEFLEEKKKNQIKNNNSLECKKNIKNIEENQELFLNGSSLN